MELRGSEGMFVSAFHREKDHAHIHIATSPLEFKTGKAFRVSKSRLQEIKLELQQYHKEKYPALTESFCKHGIRKDYVTDRKYYAKTKHERASLKESLEQTVSTLFQESKNMNDFLAKLKAQGLQYYERKGIATGILIDEIKIRFTRLGIDKGELELLQYIPDTKKEQQILPQVHTNNMNITDINFPQNTEEVNYNIKPDEFENYLEHEPKDTEQDLDKWIEDNLPQANEEVTQHMSPFNEVIRRDKRDLDLENDVER